MEPREALAANALFRDLAPEEIAKIAALATPRRFADGERVVVEDEEAKELFLILDGRAEVEVRWPLVPQETQQIGRLRAGDAIGEVALVDRCLRSATVRAVGPLETIAIPNAALRKALEESPRMGYRVMEAIARLLAARIRETNLKLRNTIANLSY
jgi:CRP-like cAMP-binding protein